MKKLYTIHYSFGCNEKVSAQVKATSFAQAIKKANRTLRFWNRLKVFFGFSKWYSAYQHVGSLKYWFTNSPVQVIT